MQQKTIRTAKKPCPCKQQICGDMSYTEMLAALKAGYLSYDQGPIELERIHNKWKRIAAEV